MFEISANIIMCLTRCNVTSENGTYDVSELSAELQVNLLLAAHTCSKRTFLLTRVTLLSPPTTPRVFHEEFPPQTLLRVPLSSLVPGWNQTNVFEGSAVPPVPRERRGCRANQPFYLTRSSSTVVDGVFVDPDGSCNFSTTKICSATEKG